MEILKANETYSEIGELTDCFYSYFIIDNTLYSVHRRHQLFSYDTWPQSVDDNISQIIFTTYEGKNPHNIRKEEVLLNGNDPRVVSDDSCAYVIAEKALYMQDPFTLTILPENKQLPIQLGEGVQQGKNWQPFLKNGELFIVDSISPFQINKVNVETGVISCVQVIDTDLTLHAAHDHYPIMRGGSNALVANEKIYGWGHATVKPYLHVPFIWESNGHTVATSFLTIDSYFKQHGYNIVDPASFIEWDEEHFALSLSCSQRDWFHPQWFLNVLVVIKKDDFFNKTISTPQNIVLRNAMIWHATDLDTLVDSSIVNGGRFNQQKKGCLVCGPSTSILLDKKWTVELCYSSLQSSSELVGDFDILLLINGTDEIVASTQIFGTNGKSTRTQLTFEKNLNNQQALIQTRVFSVENVSLTAYFFELIYA